MRRTRSKAWRYLVPIALAGSFLASPALFGTARADVTVASDDFNRADGGLGGNWTAVAAGGLAISSDVAVGTAAAGATGNAGVTGDVWSANSFGADQFSSVQLTSVQLTGGEWIGPAVRESAGGNCYVGIYYWNSGSPMLMLFLESGGGWTVLGSAATGPLGAGTQLEVRALGSTVSLLENGVPQVTATNSALSGGAPGILAFGDGQVDNWSGGTAVAASYTVGGSVSGLSGTVVLADNGGDALTVSSNGSFTFATALANGSAYAVTVASQPSGQTCTVSGGSGTVSGSNVTSVLVSCAASSGSSGGGSSGGGSSATSASDNFNRPNGGLGANWTAVAAGGLAISSGVVVGTAAAGATGNAGVTGDVWSANSFGADQFSSVQLTSVQLTGGQWVGAAVRVSAGGNCYVGIYYWNNGNPELMLFLESGGGWTVLGSYASGALGAGTQLQVTAAGSTVRLLENGTPVVTATNSALSGGAPGILVFGDGQVGNWSGGTVVSAPPASYAVGGSVSGLSGTVVLADNGGDALTVSSNGSFTFATALANGSSYAVTVSSQPSGQTCTVSGGSGTVSGAAVTGVVVTCATSSGSSGSGSTSASDNFNRANGGLGANWTAVAAGGLAISSGVAVGTTAAGVTGDSWSANSFGGDQFSQVTLTSVQLTGGQWVGAAVRVSGSGANGYVGIYYWNNGSPMLMLFRESGGGWTTLGSASTGPLGAGTALEVTAVGSTVTLLENGTPMVTATDSALSGGSPGIMVFGTGQVGNWSGGNASAPAPIQFQVSYVSTDSRGIEYYNVTSPDNGPGAQVMRVLPPANPAPGVKHNFLFVLPVEAGLATDFGDGLATLQSMNAQNQYNLTIVEPSFSIDPWYADNPTNPNVQYESFMTSELVPWVDANLATSGSEQNWLIGFSKSGIGGQDLILKHPNLFALAATWDFPADMSSAGQFGSDSSNGYGTDANFQQNYELTQAFVDAHKAPFVANNRIWIGGYYYFGQDVSDYGALLTAEGIQHTTETPTYAAHTWTSGWVPMAMAALYQDSLTY